MTSSETSPLPATVTPSLPPLSLVSSSSTSKTSFSTISEKLDLENYLLWCQQVEHVIKAQKLHHFLINPSSPTKFNSLEDASHVSYTIKPFWTGFNLQCRVISCKNSWILRDKLTCVLSSICRRSKS